MIVANILISEIDEARRSREDYGDIDLLVSDIRENGLYHPIVVYKKQGDPMPDTDETKPYLLLAGGRRLTAVRRLEMEEVPAHIVDRVLTPQEIRVIELHENMIRKDMSWAEQVRLKKEIYDLQVAIHGPMRMVGGEKQGVSASDVADMLGVTRMQLHRDLELAKAIETNPEITQMDNKSSAMKKLEAIKEDLLKQELVRRQQAKKSNTSEANIKKQLCASYIIKDAFEGMKGFEPGTFDLIEIDPPYAVDLKSLKKLKGEDVKLDVYNEVPQEGYMNFLEKIMEHAVPLLKDTGWLIMWFASDPWFEIVNRYIRLANLQCTKIPGIWVKGRGQTMQPNYNLANAYEMFFYARGERSIMGKPGTSNIFAYPPMNPDDKIHPTERPIEMIQNVLETFVMKGSNILVPFAGSGNTLLAAHNAGMNAIGFDLVEEYKSNYDFRVMSSEDLVFKSYNKK